MTSQALRARADARGRAPSIARQLERFRPEIRDAVAALAWRHPRLADLALSFPALLVALAWPNGRFDPRPVVEGAIAGVRWRRWPVPPGCRSGCAGWRPRAW